MAKTSTQKKPPNLKRAPLPKRTDHTPEFKKSWARYNQAGRHDMTEMRKVMAILWMGDPLPPEYKDHELQGDWIGHRECHVGGDFLLIYQVTDRDVIFVDLGTHAELFR
ncbi:type II toxin-antitoxin system YafQ family toxin [Pseudomonas sp. dw_358]|uniref:type II toxin-antitoxin system YafQ family toxin n=1 Tax=Pseudomonas sp. dw_358 TaxID=2720083 RepID=UPI001BD46C06|nr:type II toxin-antitoxin system YafQ family toxin [Pseudomonas sp. dw_358]